MEAWVSSKNGQRGAGIFFGRERVAESVGFEDATGMAETMSVFGTS